ncbi:MAG: hypothetical protein KDC79_08085 [Cyclobacteriaceae bacterium]|nr:hypothetical protein [Cyclobacteriaceae bacterium]
MQKVYWATTYFVMGYAIIIAATVATYQLPVSIRASIGMVVASVVFVDFGYRFFKRICEPGKSLHWKSVVKLMSYWAILNFALDVLLLIILIPFLATGDFNWLFFKQQPYLYWAQFPMFYVFGFVAQSLYNRVQVIVSSQAKQLTE